MPAITQYDPALPLFQPIGRTNNNITINPIACPVYRKLSHDDFLLAVDANGTETACIRQETAVSLWTTLKDIGLAINKAGNPGRNEAVHLLNQYYEIPHYKFDRLGLQRPLILDLVRPNLHNIFNPLYAWGPKEYLTKTYQALQIVGRVALRWIDDAKKVCQELGPDCGWDWEEGNEIEEEAPPMPIQAHPLNPYNDLTTRDPRVRPYPARQEIRNSTNRDLILHPTASSAARANMQIVVHPNRSNAARANNSVTIYRRGNRMARASAYSTDGSEYVIRNGKQTNTNF
ncbi:hypothetical protein CC1G_12611 [Coprinopsis cinerea okayama7|uniref:Uncharacterized protein n=1 Tax=Coprinopsis cinerea (strain Okayama-7 / 130 / ATCC MYA-4618 / FGSC 9003) TaxID=240176 RepID=A8P8J4_COPC7|nr:hypothetical protein CC1G_12611 [Coprinopsis cinerea okayama7\|eukprot:XP_001839583.2 hypothetical protein CC1G_12611 [Coprinopsis cinerea okayama7\